MPLLEILLVLVILLVVALAAVGRGGELGPAQRDRPPALLLPEGEIGAEDVGALRFSTAVRGYRMDEVDAVLERLTDELRRRDEQLAQVSGEPSGPAEPAQPLAALGRPEVPAPHDVPGAAEDLGSGDTPDGRP